MPGETEESTSLADVLGGTGDSEGKASEGKASEGSFEALEQRLTKHVEATIDKAVSSLKQSQRDTIQDRVTKAVHDAPEFQGLRQINEFMERHPELLKEGVKPREVLRSAALDNLVDRELAGSTEQRQPERRDAAQADGSGVLKAEIGRILQEHGVAEDDPEVIALAKEVQGQPLLVQLTRLNELATQIAGRSDEPNVGAARGRKVNPDLEAKYRQEMLENRGRGNYVGRQIKDKYRKLGLDVDRVALI